MNYETNKTKNEGPTSFEVAPDYIIIGLIGLVALVVLVWAWMRPGTTGAGMGSGSGSPSPGLSVEDMAAMLIV